MKNQYCSDISSEWGTTKIDGKAAFSIETI